MTRYMENKLLKKSRLKRCTECLTIKSLSDYTFKPGRNKYEAKCRSCSKRLYTYYKPKEATEPKHLRTINPWHKRNASIKYRSEKVGLPYDLDVEYLESLMVPLCPILGLTMDVNIKNSVHVDRIIPELGYVKGNIALISGRANRLKNNASLTELKAIVEWLEHQ